MGRNQCGDGIYVFFSYVLSEGRNHFLFTFTTFTVSSTILSEHNDAQKYILSESCSYPGLFKKKVPFSAAEIDFDRKLLVVSKILSD